MALKEILDKIKDKLGADAPAEVSALLADATREVTDILDTLSSANRESASRKTGIYVSTDISTTAVSHWKKITFDLE